MPDSWNLLVISLLSLALAGCTTYGRIDNRQATTGSQAARYSVDNAVGTDRSGEVTLVLAFSGGGTRAAALAYGVIKELRDTTITIDGRERRLLDEVDVISSVSGGSFTAAYLGLFGDRIFTDFERVFLRRDVTRELLHGLFNPAQWFSSRGRTDMAVGLYESSVFEGATFADLHRRSGPLIVINASDLGRGVRFSFLQEYFDLLCSDLASFPVARAVTASSAVPVLFNPVVLENHPDCQSDPQSWLRQAKRRVAESPQLVQVVEGLRSYADKEQRRFIHLVDGGITDNLGLRALYEIVEVGGGAKQFVARLGRPAPRFALISVNASADTSSDLDASALTPDVEQTIDAVSNVQLHRYNAATLELMQESVRRWSRELSTPEAMVESYFVKVDFRSIAEAERRQYFNRIPTSLSLDAEQVDELIAAGRELMRANPQYQRFIADLRRTAGGASN